MSKSKKKNKAVPQCPDEKEKVIVLKEEMEP